MQKSPILPPWSLMVVEGDNVGPVYGVEIAVRTCRLANLWADSPYHAELREAAGVHSLQDLLLLHDRYRCLDLDYLGNDVLAPLAAPTGWCSWNGSIGCDDINVGPGATVKSLEQEWRRIAAAFPFLSLTCQVFDREYGMCGEPQPLAEFYVSCGVVGTQLHGIEALRTRSPEPPQSIVGFRNMEAAMHRAFHTRPCNIDAFRWAIVDLEHRFGPQYRENVLTSGSGAGSNESED